MLCEIKELSIVKIGLFIFQSRYSFFFLRFYLGHLLIKVFVVWEYLHNIANWILQVTEVRAKNFFCKILRNVLILTCIWYFFLYLLRKRILKNIFDMWFFNQLNIKYIWFYITTITHVVCSYLYLYYNYKVLQS